MFIDLNKAIRLLNFHNLKVNGQPTRLEKGSEFDERNYLLCVVLEATDSFFLYKNIIIWSYTYDFNEEIFTFLIELINNNRNFI